MNPALHVACPFCHAPVNSRCTATGLFKPLQLHSAHPSRLDAAGLPPQHEQALAKYRETDPDGAGE